LREGWITIPVSGARPHEHLIQETHERMAKETGTPELNSEDMAVLLKALRDSGRPMTARELVDVLRKAAR
jgi:hypothetical protein